MPLYSYQCTACGSRDLRVAGLDDHTALCVQCSGLMLRLDEDIFASYCTALEDSGAELGAKLAELKYVAKLVR